MGYTDRLETGTNNNVKIANDLLIELVFEPLNKLLQDADMYLEEFSYYNHRNRLLVVGTSDKYLVKISVIDSNAGNTSFDAIKIEIVYKGSLLKIDEQILYFDTEFSAIKKNRQALTMINKEQDMASTVYQISDYIGKWITLMQDVEDKKETPNNSPNEQLKLGFDMD